MGTRILIPGLILNALALAGIVILGVCLFLGLQANHRVEVLIPFEFCWGLFTLGSLMCLLGSPAGARLASGTLFALTVLTMVLYFIGREGMVLPFCIFSLLLYCIYQDILARVLDDKELRALVKRAYDRPLRVFLVGTIVVLLGFSFKVDDTLLTWFGGMVFVGCPLWGFAYLGVVSLHIVKALKAQGGEKPVRTASDF